MVPLSISGTKNDSINGTISPSVVPHEPSVVPKNHQWYQKTPSLVPHKLSDGTLSEEEEKKPISRDSLSSGSESSEERVINTRRKMPLKNQKNVIKKKKKQGRE